MHIQVCCSLPLISFLQIQGNMNLIDGTPNKKLESFRALFIRDDIMKQAGGCIDAYLLPSTDAHQVCLHFLLVVHSCMKLQSKPGRLGP